MGTIICTALLISGCLAVGDSAAMLQNTPPSEFSPTAANTRPVPGYRAIASEPDVSTTDCLAEILATAPAEPVSIARVIDGDTVVLSDNRRVRLIGYNALELSSPDDQSKIFARQAKRALDDFLKQGQVLLITGQDPKDRYERLLAHLRLADGRDAGQTLVTQGLAVAVAVGNNTRCSDTLLAMERQARASRRGLWNTPGEWLLNSRLTGQERGFHLVSGKVAQIKGRKSRTSLVLDNGLQVKLGRSWPRRGPNSTATMRTLLGKQVRVRGWLGTVSGKQSLTLYHPGNLEILN